jgi:hypothetical protein
VPDVQPPAAHVLRRAFREYEKTFAEDHENVGI